MVFAALLLGGCVAPIEADRVTTQEAYDQVDANALRTDKPSANTVSLLHRYDLDRLAAKHPDEAVRQMYQKAVSTGDRDLLFALSEMSYLAGEDIRRSLKSCETRDARDYYLGSAVYAWLFLYGEGKDPKPDAFKIRFREACEFYNTGVGLAMTERRNTNATMKFVDGWRPLPVGGIQMSINYSNLPSPIGYYDRILLADQFRVRGLSVRNRQSGVGAPLICVGPVNTNLGVRQCAPATAFLRLPHSLAEVDSGKASCTLELYSALDTDTVKVNNVQVPLENDFTTYRAYSMNQAFIWNLGMLQFLAPSEHVRSQLILNQPYVPGRIPVVFVHGTFSSPVTWAEMANTLIADPVLRKRCEYWSFVYSSGNPLVYSAAELRDALTTTVKKLDPEGKDPALRQMVLVAHSQGGLLTKLAVTDVGDRIWRILNTNRLEDLNISASQKTELRKLLFPEPVPFVTRVVFICTPHRGSYLAGSFARRLARRLMTLPSAVIARGKETLAVIKTSSTTQFLNNRIPTSLDSMSPKNPAIKAVAELPVTPAVKAHSIIAVKGKGDYHEGHDGVVAYKSARQDYVESELVVRGPHTCLGLPATIEEVRRILHEHLDQLPLAANEKVVPIGTRVWKELENSNSTLETE